MAKVRAYKIAEELGLEGSEFLRRAKEAGFELKSHMVGLEEEQADELRRKLGAAPAEKRIEKRVGKTVIRRRVRKEPEPAPKEAAPVVAEPTPAAEEPAAVPEPVAPVVPPVAEEPLVEEPPAAPAPEPLAASAETPAPAPPTPAPEPEAPVVAPMKTTPARPVEPPPLEARPVPPEPERAGPAKVHVRREIIQTVNLREQETLARQLRDKAQRRLEQRRQIVEQQSRAQAPHRRARAAAQRAVPPREVKRVIKLSGAAPLAELSRQAGVKIQELLRRGRGLGLDLDREGLVDLESAELLATDLGLEFHAQIDNPEEKLATVEAAPADLAPRSPVVTVMGHVDHGKTSLLDAIRQTNVVEGEAGGITQHIGAYKVKAGEGEIAFVDTPGHAAFTQMRARGAQVTDVAVLVVAADDGIMPQSVEAMDHARAAGVPIIVAINKVDKPDANPQRTRQQLLERGLVPEDLGGETICVEVSATKGTNLDKLLEMINLQAEVLELRARIKGPARGTVIEAQLEKGRGPVATVLVREGTLRRGDVAVAGTAYGRLRTLTNERGETLKEATPSTPVQVTGLSAVPDAGDEFVVVANEKEAKDVAEHRVAEQRRAASGETAASVEAEDLFSQLDATEKKQLSVVLKADVRGTAEAIRSALEDLSTERVKLEVIHSGVGAITESDIMLASASQALVVGFHVRPEAAARKAAEAEKVDIRTSDIVYEVLDDVKQSMVGLLPPKQVEKVEGEAEVLKTFSIPRVGTIAGCAVRDGVFKRSNQVRVVRDGVPVYSGRVGSLRRFKDDVREVQSGFECGIGVENFNDIKVGDRLESFAIEERPDTL
jgi:translation initiation factor IF-2